MRLAMKSIKTRAQKMKPSITHGLETVDVLIQTTQESNITLRIYTPTGHHDPLPAVI